MEIKKENFLLKNNKYKNVIYWILLSVLLLHLVFYIFVGFKAFMNGDSTFFIDYSVEQIQSGKVFPENWVHANDFWIYSLIPIMTPLIKLGCEVVLSRQIAAFIQSVLLVLLIIDLFGREIKDKTGLKIALVLIVSGISGQFIFEIFGDATYGTIAFYMLLEVLLFMKALNDESKHRKLFLSFFGIILALITTCSLRFPIYIGAPLIAVLLYLIYNNKIKKEYIIIMLTIVFSILVGYIGHKYLESKYILNTTYDTNYIVEDSNMLQTNLSKMMFDFLTLCGSTNLNTRGLQILQYNDEIIVSSPYVVLTFFRFIFALVTLIIPFLLLKHIKEMKQSEKYLLLYTVFLMIIIVFFLLLGNLARWFRYITPVLFFMILLYPLCYRYLFSVENKRKILFLIYIILCVITSLYFVITASFDFKEFKLRENYYQHLTNFLCSVNLEYGYTYGIGANIFYTLSQGQTRALQIDTKKSEVREWLCSKDWIGTDYYNGKVYLIKEKNATRLPVETVALRSYDFDNFKIIIFRSNEVFLDKLKELKGDDE
ncbi:MAG: hypothetical protein IKI57_02590 [Clostridia bacterium]|nr:hypothetical protein [Clostridia bacterium]